LRRARLAEPRLPQPAPELRDRGRGRRARVSRAPQRADRERARAQRRGRPRRAPRALDRTAAGGELLLPVPAAALAASDRVPLGAHLLVPDAVRERARPLAIHLVGRAP